MISSVKTLVGNPLPNKLMVINTIAGVSLKNILEPCQRYDHDAFIDGIMSRDYASLEECSEIVVNELSDLDPNIQAFWQNIDDGKVIDEFLTYLSDHQEKLNISFLKHENFNKNALIAADIITNAKGVKTIRFYQWLSINNDFTDLVYDNNGSEWQAGATLKIKKLMDYDMLIVHLDHETKVFDRRYCCDDDEWQQLLNKAHQAIKACDIQTHDARFSK